MAADFGHDLKAHESGRRPATRSNRRLSELFRLSDEPLFGQPDFVFL